MNPLKNYVTGKKPAVEVKKVEDVRVPEGSSNGTRIEPKFEPRLEQILVTRENVRSFREFARNRRIQDAHVKTLETVLRGGNSFEAPISITEHLNENDMRNAPVRELTDGHHRMAAISNVLSDEKSGIESVKVHALVYTNLTKTEKSEVHTKTNLSRPHSAPDLCYVNEDEIPAIARLRAELPFPILSYSPRKSDLGLPFIPLANGLLGYRFGGSYATISKRAVVDGAYSRLTADEVRRMKECAQMLYETFGTFDKDNQFRDSMMLEIVSKFYHANIDVLGREELLRRFRAVGRAWGRISDGGSRFEERINRITRIMNEVSASGSPKTVTPGTDRAKLLR